MANTNSSCCRFRAGVKRKSISMIPNQASFKASTMWRNFTFHSLLLEWKRVCIPPCVISPLNRELWESILETADAQSGPGDAVASPLTGVSLVSGKIVESASSSNPTRVGHHARDSLGAASPQHPFSSRAMRAAKRSSSTSNSSKRSV